MQRIRIQDGQAVHGEGQAERTRRLYDDAIVRVWRHSDPYRWSCEVFTERGYRSQAVQDRVDPD